MAGKLGAGSLCSARAPWLLKLARCQTCGCFPRRTPADGDVALIKHQHLSALNDARIPCRTRRPDRVMRAGDPHIQSDFARRIIGTSAGLVMVRPHGRVVIVRLISWISFSVSTFPCSRDTDVDANQRKIELINLSASTAWLHELCTINTHRSLLRVRAETYAPFLVPLRLQSRRCPPSSCRK